MPTSTFYEFGPIPDELMKPPTPAKALALRTECIRIEHAIRFDRSLVDYHDKLRKNIRDRIELRCRFYSEIISKYPDLMGGLNARQIAREKKATRDKGQALVLSSDDDGEDELGVMQELDRSDSDAEMVQVD
jgi:hypothetical protein